MDSYSLSMLREDEIHPFVSGNKFRKLKYTVKEALRLQKSTLLTFGGAYSNHIAAVAAAGKELGLSTIGVIRGDELEGKELEGKELKNPTLQFAQDCGMQLHYISRQDYRLKTETTFIENLEKQFGNFYLIPEGGTQSFAIQGCEEILSELTNSFDYICVPVGTGGTMAGLVKASKPHQTIIGYSALKGTFQDSEVKKYTSKDNYEIIDDYCFGGYAKIDSTLVRFINEFKHKTNIPLDPVYVGKMMYGILDGMKNKKFKENSRILAIHTGGLQGISGMNLKLKKKQLPQIL
ncbi:MAG: 1-aminocyclopropane-1-carboxylate deaminase/D-cysteine desulfhydrase [Flavobacteriaceae bacterium]|nr:1-aminocyclopropane-1-carboxylate deaminase/D-cysteine desulfhydrase [Flavobacteriaceae bacterium]